jgi:hypothetical protein
MAQKTQLSPNEVSDLLMVAPLSVFEWVQQAKLHVHLEDDIETSFSQEDLRFFAQMRGQSISRPDKNIQRILIVDSDLRVTWWICLRPYPRRWRR